jgi:hypothetical protein
MARDQGNLGAAQAHMEECLVLVREMENKPVIAESLAFLGDVMGEQGEDAAACKCFRESIAISQELKDEVSIARLLERFGILAATEGRPERAARLLGASEAAREVLDDDWRLPHPRNWYDREVTGARTALGEEAFAAAWAEGRAMSLEQAIHCALEETSRT